MKTCSKLVLLTLTIVFTIESCKKDNKTTPSPSGQATTSPVISGYTWTDATGNFIGTVDTTDWRTDDTWNQNERNLFGGTNYNSNCLFNDSLLWIIPGPNPTSDYFNIYVDMNGGSTDTTTKVEMLLINQHWQLLTAVQEIHHNTLISLDNLDNNINDTIFRVYYKFTDKNNCVRCGHGDILRN